MGTNITGIGNANAIGFKSRVTGGIYFPPELKDALVGVWSAYGKSNDSTDRNIIKNKIKDRSGDFVISNAAFKLNSGFGKYETELSNTRIWTQSKETTSSPFSSSYNGLSGWLVFANTELTNSADMPSFKIQVKGLLEGQELIYRYYDSNGQSNVYSMGKDGEYTLPADIRTAKAQTSNTSGFQVVKNDTNIITITQIPSFQGAFVTDGIDDLITSTKTVQEMGITDEITVVSMIHKISSDNNWTNLIGELKEDHTFVANRATNTDKTGIYGYTYNYVGDAIIINNILGDKNDYIVRTSTSLGLDNKYYVTGFRSAGIIQNISQIAWYWTFIANRVLTTDEINQVIAYYNLDRTLKPGILCNITKQGITNDNHADFNDKLIDYSGNGRDIQMYNLAWKGGSGIAAKKFETIKDYNIIPDEGLQELTIYNEFSYKVKSIKYADRYWAVQSLNKTDMSYPVTIITDKDIIWRNTLNYTDADGVKGNVKKETNVPANTPTQVFIYGFNDFDISDDYTKVNCVAYATRKDITEFTVTFIPSCKGGILLDGVNDFGQFVGDLGLKDYTLIMNRAYNNLINNQVPLISSNIAEDQTPFIVEHWNTDSNAISFSYGASRTTDIPLDINKKIVYQSTYSYMGYVIPKGNAISTGGDITLGKFGNGVQYSAICLWSLMLFPYSMSEFLIERQLKKHKLGTLYPNMIEFRPVIKANANYNIFYTALLPLTGIVWEKINIGDYIPVGRRVAIQLSFDNEASELVSAISSQLGNISITKNSNNKGYTIFGDILKNKSPQKINITIDEYIRYEDIKQPYPVIFQIKDRNTSKKYNWGDKIKVGSSIQLIQGENPNLLNGLYSIRSYKYEGKAYSYNQLTNLNITVTKQSISLSCDKIWLLDNNEPKVILSPRLLRIPNSSYKILGYIPDISGHGNHGVIHNSAYTEGSGVNEDGSYQFDGVDDFVAIPTLSSGGKQVLMKVNWQNDYDAPGYMYDSNTGEYRNYIIKGNKEQIAYENASKTYIDGILNANLTSGDLKDITHNITSQFNNASGIPYIGCRYSLENFLKMSLYDFMLFDNISTGDKIKELNEYVGIEAKVELPPYYWDTYGKTNLDADKATIQQRGVAVGDYDLTNTNFAYDKMSGFGGYTLGKFTNSWALSNSNNSISIVARNPYDITLKKLGENNDWEFNNTELKIISNPVSVKFKSDKNIRFTCDYHYYTVGGNSEGAPLRITSKDLIANEDTIITISPISQENIDKYNIDINRGYYLIYFQLSLTLAVNEEVTIEMLPLYPNGLAYDGVSDFTDNKNIPILTDFAFIIKREILGLETNGSMLVIKGDKVYNGGIGNAFILEHNSNGVNYVYSYGKLNQIKRDDSKIIYLTPKSYNGNPIIKSENGDNLGLILGKYWKGIIYKIILYSKTISLLEINFLKNLMERDEIIDLTNPIFIKNE